MNISSLNVVFFTIDLLKNDNVNLARNVSPPKWHIFWVLAPYSRSEFSVYLFLPPVNKNSPKLCNHFNFGNMPQRRHLNVEELSRGIGMLQGGLSQRRVAAVLAVSQSVVSRAWRRFRQCGSARRRHGGGRQRSTTHRQDRYLITTATRSRRSNATSLQQTLQNASGVTVSTQTVRNRLHAAGLRARRPVVRVPHTRQHRQNRLEWCIEHRTWTLQQWANVLFTYESRFCLDFNDGRIRVWRRSGERYADANVVEHDRYRGGSVMVWGGVSLGAELTCM